MRTTPPYKTCRVCGQTKPKEDFVEGRKVCLSCFSEYGRQQRRRRAPDRPDGVRYSKAAQCIVEYRNGYQRKYWSPSMLSFLRRLYPTTKNQELASLFGISLRTLNRKAAELELKKDDEWMKKMSGFNCFLMTVKNRANGHPQLVKARKALEIKHNNPNFTRKDRERHDRTEYNI